MRLKSIRFSCKPLPKRFLPEDSAGPLPSSRGTGERGTGDGGGSLKGDAAAAASFTSRDGQALNHVSLIGRWERVSSRPGHFTF
jgi:hypothetical protein